MRLCDIPAVLTGSDPADLDQASVATYPNCSEMIFATCCDAVEKIGSVMFIEVAEVPFAADAEALPESSVAFRVHDCGKSSQSLAQVENIRKQLQGNEPAPGKSRAGPPPLRGPAPAAASRSTWPSGCQQPSRLWTSRSRSRYSRPGRWRFGRPNRTRRRRSTGSTSRNS